MSDHLAHVADTTTTEPRTAGSRDNRLSGALVMALRVLLCLVFGLPLVFMIVSSFKPDTQIFADLDSWSAFLPVGDVSLANYTGLMDRVPFVTFMVNSVFISVCTVVLGLLVNSMAAFALSRIEFRGQKVVLGIVLATLIVPFETMALPLLWWVNTIPYFDGSQGWLDTYAVQIIPFLANAFSIYLFYQYFDSIPKELDEAATVDGAGWFRIYRSIVMPLSGPAVATVAILTFLPAWNSYLWPLMVVQSESLRPVMVGIDYFKQATGSSGTAWGQIMAYATMITVPVLALFIGFQRAFINSIASSGVKG